MKLWFRVARFNRGVDIEVEVRSWWQNPREIEEQAKRLTRWLADHFGDEKKKVELKT